MGTIVAQTLIDKASELLLDETNIRWPSTDLLAWVNDGQRAVARMDPSAKMVTASVVLVAGTLQTLPAAAVRLGRIHRNMGVGGSTPGRATVFVDRTTMDANNPNWHTDSSSAEVLNYMYDVDDPYQFWVYPQQPASSPGYIELTYSSLPTDVAIGSAIDIHDVYSTALVDYILHRAYEKNDEIADANAKAQSYYSKFVAQVAEKVAGDGKK